MAFKAVFLVALIAAAVAAAAAVNVPFGGASSTATYEQDTINGTAKYATPSDVGTYKSVDSDYGLAAYCNGSLAISSSDYPEGGCSRAACTTTGTSKYVTLPQVLGSVSFGVYGAAAGVKLTAAQIWSIYSGAYTTWSQVTGSGSGLTGPITPIVRCDGSGTTCVATSWLQNCKTAIPASEVNPGPWKPKTPIACGTGTGGVVTLCKSKIGSICYASTGSIAGSGIQEVAVQNCATGVYSTGASAKLVNSVNTTALPACTASWASVNLLNSKNTAAGTYPIVTFEYLTARQSYSGSVYSSAKVKPFLSWTQSTTAQNDAINFKFQPLPSALVSKNTACINAIV